MNFELTEKNAYNLITSKVEKVDASNASELKELFSKLKNDSKNVILVDLKATKYCDSSGLSALLSGHRYCRDTNGKFVLFGLQPMVSKLIKIAQLDRVLTISETEEQAEEVL